MVGHLGVLNGHARVLLILAYQQRFPLYFFLIWRGLLFKREKINISFLSVKTFRFAYSLKVCLYIIYFQFEGILNLIDSFELMRINQQYRKFKPIGNVRDDPRAW